MSFLFAFDTPSLFAVRAAVAKEQNEKLDEGYGKVQGSLSKAVCELLDTKFDSSIFVAMRNQLVIYAMKTIGGQVCTVIDSIDEASTCQKQLLPPLAQQIVSEAFAYSELKSFDFVNKKVLFYDIVVAQGKLPETSEMIQSWNPPIL